MTLYAALWRCDEAMTMLYDALCFCMPVHGAACSLTVDVLPQSTMLFHLEQAQQHYLKHCLATA
jgi:hypothetical protein